MPDLLTTSNDAAGNECTGSDLNKKTKSHPRLAHTHGYTCKDVASFKEHHLPHFHFGKGLCATKAASSAEIRAKQLKAHNLTKQ